MLLHVISLRNKVVEAYCTPSFEEADIDKLIQRLQRGIMLGNKQYEKHALYHLADFDDETGEFKPVNELLVDCDDIYAKL